MNITKTKVDQVLLQYTEFGGDKNATIEVTAWGGCEGHTISIDRRGLNVSLSLTHDDWDALVMAMSAMSVDSPTNEDGK